MRGNESGLLARIGLFFVFKKAEHKETLDNQISNFMIMSDSVSGSLMLGHDQQMGCRSFSLTTGKTLITGNNRMLLHKKKINKIKQCSFKINMKL